MAFEVEYFTLTGAQALNEYVLFLEGTAVTPDNVALDLIGGTAQALNGDFGADTTSVKWDNPSYNLNGVLVAGDKLRVIYDRS